jgi:hypothetical protein
MSMYTIKVLDGLKGPETILMEDFREYEIGQTIAISPVDPITVQDQHGNEFRITPKMSLRGTVIEKRY